ncbi:MAG: DUF4118 domain-containing protein [bacterium]
MDSRRKNPDELLQQLQKKQDASEKSRTQGQLKLFLGFAAGVGKTYKMLQEGKKQKKEGKDIIIGIVETHNRPDTENIARTLETFPRKTIDYKGISLTELDIDGILKRKPQIVIIDELAHTNTPGSRHLKRFQDIEELLKNGISVYTALNIQHVESLADIVKEITGITIQEIVPNTFIATADEIQVIDIPPEELMQRLKEGKVYLPAKANVASKQFFRKGNLLALRELALRFAARHVDEDMRSYKELHGISGPWQAGERLLVCISSNPASQRLIKICHKLATDFKAEWFAVFVESPVSGKVTEQDSEQLRQNFALAEQLGAKSIVLEGSDPAKEILAFSEKNNITFIVIGTSARKNSLRFFATKSVVDTLVHNPGKIHVLVVGITNTKTAKTYTLAYTWQIKPFLISSAAIATTVAFCGIFETQLAFTNIALLLLIPVVFTSISFGMTVGLFSSLLTVLCLDFFFVQPRLSFTVTDIRYFPSFLVFLLVGGITSFLSERARWKGTRAQQREKIITELATFTEALRQADSDSNYIERALERFNLALETKTRFFYQNHEKQIVQWVTNTHPIQPDIHEGGVINWVFTHGKPAGKGTETLTSLQQSYFPVYTKQNGVIAVIALTITEEHSVKEKRKLIETLLGILALGIEKGTREIEFS